jgi:hypothetical protein
MSLTYNWQERMGAVGDALRAKNVGRAAAALDELEGLITESDGDTNKWSKAELLRPKAALYAQWAPTGALRGRLLRLADGCPPCAPAGGVPSALEVWRAHGGAER